MIWWKLFLQFITYIHTALLCLVLLCWYELIWIHVIYLPIVFLVVHRHWSNCVISTVPVMELWKLWRGLTGNSLRWPHNGYDGILNHQPHDCLLNRLFRRRSKKTSKLRVTGLCVGNSPGSGEFPAQMASYAENASIWWRHHVNMIKHGKAWNVCMFLGCAIFI